MANSPLRPEANNAPDNLRSEELSPLDIAAPGQAVDTGSLPRTTGTTGYLASGPLEYDH
jgi:hypothetical protein